MSPIFFQFTTEPDEFSSGETFKLPHPQKEKQKLWQWFLPDFHNDKRKSLLENCYRYCENESLFDLKTKPITPEMRNKSYILELIRKTEEELTREALQQFYEMLYQGEIKILACEGEEV